MVNKQNAKTARTKIHSSSTSFFLFKKQTYTSTLASPPVHASVSGGPPFIQANSTIPSVSVMLFFFLPPKRRLMFSEADLVVDSRIVVAVPSYDASVESEHERE